jgi:predicted O-methyltransferase YrrM
MEENISLKDVTLCSVDCLQPSLALESLLFSSKKINFGKIILFSNEISRNIPSNVNFVKIPKITSLIEYSRFLLLNLHEYVETDYCLIVHADGYIHNPHLWTDDFKKWDYIGAPWPKSLWFVDDKTRVGNGGVSLRSKRLMKETSVFKNVQAHEDHFICQAARDYLNGKNIHIAPLDVAKKFSHELICDDFEINPEEECFAFHGKSSEFHLKKIEELKKIEKDKIENMSKIEKKYHVKKAEPSDIYMHMETLYKYAKKCENVAEFGVRNVVSSYAFANSHPKKLLCLDINDNEYVEMFKKECEAENINMEFVVKSSLDYEFEEEYDLLFIDTLHSFDQLSKELEKHHSKIKKYIIFHDTIFWGNKNEDPVTGEDTGERGENIGLVPAIRNFLKKHKEWKEVCTYTYNNGLTIIRRNENAG